MKLTEIDRMILQSYDTVLDGLAQYLGDGCEIVLHSLENLDKSVIKIVNGHHTGRKVGAPITHLALEMLDEIKKKGKDRYDGRADRKALFTDHGRIKDRKPV